MVEGRQSRVYRNATTKQNTVPAMYARWTTTNELKRFFLRKERDGEGGRFALIMPHHQQRINRQGGAVCSLGIYTALTRQQEIIAQYEHNCHFVRNAKIAGLRKSPQW